MTEAVMVIEDGRRMAKLPWEEYQRLLELAEDAEDAADLERALSDPAEERVPAEVVHRVFRDGAHPVRAWREHRGMTQEALAAAAGLRQDEVSKIETGRVTGTLAAMRALAGALGIRLDTLAATLGD